MWQCGIDGCEHHEERGEDLLVHQATAHESHTCQVCGEPIPRGYLTIRHVFEEHGRTAFADAYDLDAATIREQETILETVETELDVKAAIERISTDRNDGAEEAVATDSETGRWQNRTGLFAFGVIAILLLLAEGLILFQHGDLGLVVHAVTVAVLVVFVHRSDDHTARLFQSLLLLPILRIFNLGLPLFTDDTLVFLGIIYVSLLMSTGIVARSQNLTLADLGLTLWDARLVVPGAVIGLFLGIIQYSLGLEHIGYEPTLRNYILLILTAGLLVGLVEEVVFRGLVQRWAVDLLGRWPAIIAVSVLFGFMHSIWLAPMDIVFAGVVSVFLGWVYAATNNMWFITSIHGMINVGAFLLAPLYGTMIIDILTAVLPLG